MITVEEKIRGKPRGCKVSLGGGCSCPLSGKFLLRHPQRLLRHRQVSRQWLCSLEPGAGDFFMDPLPRRASLQNTGNVGEGWVRQYLCQQGWQILAQRWRCRWGELDLVAHKADVLIFVEVKTRSPGSWDRGGLLAVGIPKQRRLIRAAQAFLSQHPHLSELSCRFDVALIERRASREGVSYALVDYLQAAFEIC